MAGASRAAHPRPTACRSPAAPRPSRPYTFLRYQLVLGELRGLGLAGVTAQGLPGIVGRDGWLARSEWTRGTFLCTLPGLTTAVRLDIHFWWNAIEMALLIAGGHVAMRRIAAGQRDHE